MEHRIRIVVDPSMRPKEAREMPTQDDGIEKGDTLDPVVGEEQPHRDTPIPEKKEQEKPLEVGHVERNYRFVKKLGEGGFGEAWLVDDTSTCYEEQGKEICRQVVIKTLRPEKKDKERAKERFVQEIKVMTEVENEFVVRPIDAYEQNGQFRLVMNYVDGGDAKNFLQALEKNRDKFTREKREQLSAAIGYQVALALEYMASKGVLHRDLKLENILLRKKAIRSFPLVAVSDFGLVTYIGGEKPISPKEAGIIDSGDFAFNQEYHSVDQKKPRLTQEGSVVGTTQYLPPESLYGDEPTYQTDAYALGMMMYTLATGESPFDFSEDPTGIEQKRNNKFIPLHEQLQMDAPTAFTQIVDTLLDGNISERKILLRDPNGNRVAPKDVQSYTGLEMIWLKNPTDIKNAIRNAIVEEFPSMATTEPFTFGNDSASLQEIKDNVLEDTTGNYPTPVISHSSSTTEEKGVFASIKKWLGR